MQKDREDMEVEQALQKKIKKEYKRNEREVISYFIQMYLSNGSLIGYLNLYS